MDLDDDEDARKTLPRVKATRKPTPTERVEQTMRFRPLDPAMVRAAKARASEPGSAPHVQPEALAGEAVGQPAEELPDQATLLVDILEYRDLRLRSLRGEALGSPGSERYEELEEFLQRGTGEGDDEAAMRRYRRFGCAVGANLVRRPERGGTVSTLGVVVSDISAGGARLSSATGDFGVGESVWLTLDLVPADRSRLPDPEADAVVIAARVVWARPLDAELGLIFAGAPRYERDMGVGI